MPAKWTRSIPVDALPAMGVQVFKSPGAQIAIFRVEDGAIYAVDNRCPHEGYPLAQGAVTDCVLTCNWHNYKFDLRDGACVMGEEAVRSFPVRVRDGVIELDLQPPDPAKERARLWASLDQGMSAHRMGRVLRDVIRLIQTGVSPSRFVLYAAQWDAFYGEYGTTHTTPVAADVLRYLSRYPDAQAAIPLAQLLEMAAFSHVRMPRRQRPDPVDPGDDQGLARARFLAHVEAEHAPEAEALVRGALAKKWGPAVVLEWLQATLCVHFLDGGHAQIYLIKTEELLGELGWEHADPILCSLVFSIVNGTRQELLPKWSGVRDHLAGLASSLPELYRSCTEDVDPEWAGESALVHAIVDGRRTEAMAALTRALGASAPIQRVIDSIVLGASERLLRFDVAIDGDIGVQDSWLTLTHMLTYANAIRSAWCRRPSVDLLRTVFFAARVVNNGRVLDLPEAKRVAIVPQPHGGLAGIVDAIIAKRSGAVLGQVSDWFSEGQDADALRVGLEDLVLRDPVVRPIVVAHAIKLTIAAFDEHRATGDVRPVLALVRFLASPIAERRVYRLATEAIAFVTDGKVPRTLTG